MVHGCQLFALGLCQISKKTSRPTDFYPVNVFNEIVTCDLGIFQLLLNFIIHCRVPGSPD